MYRMSFHYPLVISWLVEWDESGEGWSLHCEHNYDDVIIILGMLTGQLFLLCILTTGLGNKTPPPSCYVCVICTLSPYSGGGGASLAKTLDLLKAVLQPSFNMELKRLCDDYKYIYAMAAANIRENTGDTVPVSTMRLLIMKMIEEVGICC